MPEQKKRGFHALEERIHQMEQEEDQKSSAREAGAKTPDEGRTTGEARQAPERERR